MVQKLVKGLRHYKWEKLIKKSGLFSVDFYLRTYPDVRKSNFDPLKHFIVSGAKEHRKPSASFDTSFYLAQYDDVIPEEINPLVHYILYGKSQKRFTNRFDYEFSLINDSGLFDKKFYLEKYVDIKKSGVDPLAHFISLGAKELRNPSESFDTAYYVAQYDDVNPDKVNPLIHYIKCGKSEGRKTNNRLEKKAKENNYFDFCFKQNHQKNEKEFVPFQTNAPIKTDLRLIAFYLPQFHPIPENDIAWGKGFTEWTNVSKALPQFYQHYQPRLPGELGFYDLRLIEIQKRQIELAKNYGLHGFCYHYYWFDGKKVMDRPLQQILDNPDLDFPFCINWANENWTKRWDGLDQEVIFKQNHTVEDDLVFLEEIKPILTDKRYIKINGKALIMVYRPQLFPDIQATVKRWREHANKIGIGELYLVLTHSFDHQDPLEIGFDAATEFAPNNFKVKNITSEVKLANPHYAGDIYDYRSAINYSFTLKQPNYVKFRSVCPSWDNEARKPGKGTTFFHATPENYSKWLEYLCYDTIKYRKNDERIIFINAWNEWAEGAYLEPDRRYGYNVLQTTYNVLKKFDLKRLELLHSTHSTKKESDTAVVLHLYYTDLWDEIRDELKNFTEPIDLYININNNSDNKEIERIKRDFPAARIYSYENRGRDILPFLKTLEIILPLRYQYVCKIHSKKSLHRVDGNKWRNHLIGSLIGSPEKILKSKKALDNNAGIVVAKGNVFSFRKWIGSNESMVSDFVQKTGIGLPNDFTFPAGSMFWFKPDFFEPLLKHVHDSTFIVEEGQIDGTIAHAVERVFGLLCHENNLDIVEI